MSPSRETPVEIRQVGPDDLSAVLWFFAGLSPESRRTFAPHPFDEEHARRIVETSDGVGNVRLVAVRDGGIQGYCYFESRGPDLYPTVGLGIIDRAQNQGVGSRLMAALVAEARRLGKPGLVLTVHMDNPRALRLYTKNGYRITGECSNGTQWEMTLELGGEDSA